MVDVVGTIRERQPQEVHIGELGDGDIVGHLDILLEVLHCSAMEERMPDGVGSGAGLYLSYWLVNSGIGIGVILEFQVGGYIVLQTIVAPPGELLEIGRLHYYKGSTLVSQHRLFEVTINLGREGEVARLVHQVEFF